MPIVEGSVVRAERPGADLRETFPDQYRRSALWAGNFERNFTDVLALQSDVATAIARGIQVELSATEQSQLARSRSVVPQAYEAYLRGTV